MASIITATTTSGLTQSADNSGVLQLASGTGNLVTVPSVTGTAMVSGNMPAFSAYAGAATSCANNVFTKVLFNTEEFDTNNNFASSTFTPTVAGYYQINSSVNMAVAPANLLISLNKNGSEYKRGSYASATGLNTVTVSSIVYLNGSTDNIDIRIYQGSGVSANTATGIEVTWFNGVLVRTA
jgi:hypothetical protein